MCHGMTNLTVVDILIPNTITTVGDNFCFLVFYFCSSLTSPFRFQPPQCLTTVGSDFCDNMFAGCSRLRNDSTNLVTITIPNISSTGLRFCRKMFYECNGLNHSTWTWWPTPIIGSTITINAN